MHPAVAHAHSDLDELARPHLYGHRCEGNWYKNGTPCPVSGQILHVREQVDTLVASVRDAWQDPAAVDAVTAGMTGFVLADLGDEDREGWRDTGRMALQAAAAHLLGEPDREHFTCHREGSTCTWDGCPIQHDDAADESCFLIQPGSLTAADS